MTRARLVYTIKVTIAYTLYYTGLFRVWQAIALRRKAVVLMYHRVLTPDARRRTGSHPGIVVDRTTFARHMAVLKRHFVVLSTEDFVGRMTRREPLPDSSCLITFDDGWRDNLTNALPILQQHQLPALIFLPVNYIGRRRLFWREALAHVLVRAAERCASDSGPHGMALRERVLSLLEGTELAPAVDVMHVDRTARIVQIVAADRTLTWATAWPLLDALAAALTIDLEKLSTPDDFMTWDEIAQLSTHGIAFGGHGAEHRLLTELTAEEADAEIRASKDGIASRLAAPVTTFSYPNGSWTPAIADQVRDNGFALAFTTVPGFVSCDDDPFRVRRINIHEDMTDSTPMFLARVMGLF